MTTATEQPATSAPSAWPPLAADVARDDLVRALRAATDQLPVRPPVPALSGLRLTAVDGGLEVVGFDYERLTRQVVSCDAAGAALLPGRMLREIATAVPAGGPVTFAPVDKGQVLIAGDDAMWRITPMAADEYPALPSLKSTRTIATLTGGHLQTIARAAVAAGDDDTLPVLTTTCWATGVDGLLEVAATDRYRLTMTTVQAPSALKDGERLLIPAELVRAAASRQWFRASGRVEVQLLDDVDQWVAFTDGARTLAGRLVPGQFPKVHSLLPTSTAIEVLLDRVLLARAIHQVSLAATRHSPIRLTINPTRRTLRLDSATDDGWAMGDDDTPSAKATKSMPLAAGEGDEIHIGFNPRYLLDALAAQTSDQVRLRFTVPGRPALIDCPTDPAILYLLMPVRLVDDSIRVER